MIHMAILDRRADVKLEDAPFVFAITNRFTTLLALSLIYDSIREWDDLV